MAHGQRNKREERLSGSPGVTVDALGSNKIFDNADDVLLLAAWQLGHLIEYQSGAACRCGHTQGLAGFAEEIVDCYAKGLGHRCE